MLYLIQSRMTALITKLSSLSVIVLFLGGFLIQLSIMMLFAVLWWKDVSAALPQGHSWQNFLLLVIVAPLVETIIWQWGIIESMISTFRSKFLAVIVSAVAFALTHYYSLQYIVATFFSGLLFGLLYLVFQEKNRKGFVYVLILHATYNLFVFIMKYLNR